MIRAVLLALSLALGLAAPALAVQPDEILDDPVLEERARDISANVRCVVCQNESIDASNAPVARDLRLLVRERLVAGDEDSEVYAFLRERYGDFVLFSPPWQPSTYLLWVGPFLIVGLGAMVAITALLRRGRKAEVAALSAEEAEAFDTLMGRRDG
ncbi:MAG: cytochrome c-type biogenesis protein [Pseudomonadota bacterium]